MFDVWLGMTILGTGIAATGKIGGSIAAGKRNQEKFDNMLDDLHDKFCDKYDLDSNKEDSSL